MRGLGHFRSGLASLGHRNYRLFWGGQVFSLVGAWMQTVAQSWLILELTNSTFQVGLVIAIQFLPILVFGAFGGLFADRFDKRRSLILTQSCAALQALVLGTLIVTGEVRPVHVMVLAGFLGLVNAVDMPTRQSFVPELVGKRDVLNAVALNSSAFNLARIVGPGIGGVIIAQFGVAPAFFINAVSFAGVLVALLRMRPQELYRDAAPRKRETVLESLRGGVSYVWRSRVISAATGLVGIVATFGMNFGVLLPGMARSDFGIGSEGFGLFMSSLGVGSLLAGLFIAFFSRLSPKRLMIWGAVGFGVFEAIFAFTPRLGSVPLAVVLLMLIGFCTICMTATANTAVQRTAPDELRGRIMSIYVAIFAGSMPVGSLFAGTLARWFGVQTALAAGAALSLVGALWAWSRLRSWSGEFDPAEEPGVGSVVVAPLPVAGREAAPTPNVLQPERGHEDGAIRAELEAEDVARPRGPTRGERSEGPDHA